MAQIIKDVVGWQNFLSMRSTIKTFKLVSFPTHIHMNQTNRLKNI